MSMSNGVEVEPTASLWLRMLGLDGLWETANSPAFQGQINDLVNAILSTNARCQRIEDALHELTTAFAANGSVGARGHSAASGVADNGGRDLAHTVTDSGAIVGAADDCVNATAKPV